MKNVLRGRLQACLEARQPADQMTLQIQSVSRLLPEAWFLGREKGGGVPHPRTQSSPCQT